MAKKSKIVREHKLIRNVKKYASLRAELKNIIQEYKLIVSKYPRKGLGVEPLCSDAGLEDPVTVFRTDEKVTKEVNLN